MGNDVIFAKRLSEAMEQRGISLSELSRRTGINKGQLSRYRNGINKNLSEEIIRIIAEALNVSPAWLRGYSDGEIKAWSDADLASIDISRVLVARLMADGYTQEKAERRVEQIMGAIGIQDQASADAAWNLMDKIREQLSPKSPEDD